MGKVDVESVQASLPPLERRIFCNRTLNLRSIQAVGLDMDYTLVHYDSAVWENRAFEHARDGLLVRGWPVESLKFDAGSASLGLMADLELGNMVKANRFGQVHKASHGTRMLEYEERRATYGDEVIALGGERWLAMDTLFSLSESCLYMQAVELFDANRLPGVGSYRELYRAVRDAVDVIHMEGKLKAEIMAQPEKFVVLDPELPLALIDLRNAGKKLLLITNSEWKYTNAMMSYALDRYLPEGETWRSLFDVVCVQARKPTFFSTSNPVLELVDAEAGTFKPHVAKLQPGKVYLGADARIVEESLNIRGDDILYIGDHIFTDVYASKDLLRWRTALVLRELEQELLDLRRFESAQNVLRECMDRKELLEHRFSQLRLQLQRSKAGYGEQVNEAEYRRRMMALRNELVELDARISPLAKQSSELVNPRWGQLMRCGSDKSHLARQIERFADVYMSRVSNLLAYTPFVYMRAPRGTLPHDVSLGAELTR
jgi:5'-nucleotidase